MALRWTAAGMMEAIKGFRRLKAHKYLATLMPHSITDGDACLAYFNKIWGIPPTNSARLHMAYQLVPLHGWLLPPHPVGRYAGARAVAASSTEAAPSASFAPRHIWGRRLFLTIIRQRLPFQS